MKSRNVGILAGVILLVAGGILWGVYRRTPNEVPVLVKPTTVHSKAETPDAGNSLIAVSIPVTPGMTVGELLSDENLSERALLAGLTKIVLSSSRKPAERNEAMSHLLNLTVEENESTLAALARDSALDPVLAQRLFEDGFNRSLNWQADLGLLLLAREDAEPLRAAVREHLVFLVSPDTVAGKDINAFKTAVLAAKKRWAEQAAQ